MGKRAVRRIVMTGIGTVAAVGLVGERGGPASLTASARQDRVFFAVSQTSVSVPESWVERTYDAPWPATPAGNLSLMQAARRIAELHSGQATASSIVSCCTVSAAPWAISDCGFVKLRLS